MRDYRRAGGLKDLDVLLVLERRDQFPMAYVENVGPISGLLDIGDLGDLIADAR